MPKTSTEWETVLRQICPRGANWIVIGFADALPALCERCELLTANRQAHFLAQCAHESDHLKTTTEYASGAAYEGRKDLGNIQSGDGRRFKGRGLIQLTGRYNYEQASQALGRNFVADPESVAKFPAAADVSGWFWATHQINRHADADDVKAATKAVNGGLTGIDSRTAYLASAKKALA
jgi:putative chitinase